MNFSNIQLKTKSILAFALGMVFALTAALALWPAEANAAVNWVANPASCPQSDPANFPGQNCAPNNMCGDSSGIAQCYNTGSISAPGVSANSSVLYASALTGGYVINCFTASDSGSPYCDNNGAAWCNRDASCYGGGNNRLTTCLAGTWAYEGASSYTCGDCLTTHLDCTGDTKCEVQKNTTTYPTGGNNHYGTTCDVADVRCNTSYYDCDASGVTLGNGCEAYRAGACTGVGGLAGTWSCSVDAGGTCTDGGSNYTCTCVTPKCPFESATLCQYFSSDPLLWGKQLGSGELIRMGNTAKEDAFVVNNDGSIRMATTSAPGVTTNSLYNVGGDLYWDGTLIGAGASSSALDFQQVTDLGNITTNWIEFAGGTSTADLSIVGDINVSGDAYFVNATGTNITVAEQFILGQYAVLPAAGYEAGSMVFSTADSVPYFWDGADWVAFATGTGAGGGTLADAYNFGGAAAGRQILTVDGSTPVEIINPGTDQWETSLALTNGANGGGLAMQTMESFGDFGSRLYFTDNTSDPENGTGAYMYTDNTMQAFEFGYQNAGTRNSSFYIDANQMSLNIPGTQSNGAFGIMASNYNIPILNMRIQGPSFSNQVHLSVGTSTPEAKVTAESGSVYFRTDGVGSNQQMYVKTTDVGNTGWFALAGAGVANSIWDADSDTGIQVEESPDEDIIRFDVAGHQAMTINQATGEPLMAINSPLGGYAYFLANNNDEYDRFEFRGADTLSQFYGDTVFNFNPEEGFALYYTSNIAGFSLNNNFFTVGVNNHQDAIKVDENAFVGLSTSTPAYRLDVYGDARVNDQLMLGQYALNPLAGLQAGAMVYNTASSTPFFWDGAEWIAFATGTGSGAGDLQAVTDIGNLTTNWIEFAGGTSTDNFTIERPTGGSTLTVRSVDDDAYLRLIGNAGATDLMMSSDNGGNWSILETSMDGSLNIVVDGTTAIFAEASTGNVGVGVTDPNYKMDIFGGVVSADNLFKVSSGVNNGFLSVYMDPVDDRNSIIKVMRDLSFVSEGWGETMMHVSDNGLGIGTVSPAYGIDVVGDARVSAELMLGQYALLPAAGLQAGSIVYNTASSTPFFWDGNEWVAFATGTGSGAGDLQAVTDIGNLTTNWIEFAGGTSTGNFLINRPSAEAYLTVNSGNSDAYFDLIGNAGATALRMSSNGGGNYASFEIATNGSFNMVADGTGVLWADAPTGNVGIGESTPGYRLHIDGGAVTGNNLFRAEAGLNGGHVSMYVSSTDDRNSVIGFQRNLEFFSQNQMIMTITNSQHVGIGITNPLYAFDVAGDARISDELMLGQYPTNPLTGSAAGSLIYNSSDDLVYFWDNSEWRALLADGDVTLDEAYDGAGAGLGRQITTDAGAVRLSGAGNGTAFQIDYSGTGQGFAYNNSGGGDGVVIAQTGTSLGMYIRQNNGRGFLLDNNTANDGMTIDTNAGGNGLQITNDGVSSHGMRIDNDTDGSGIFIEDTIGKSAININKTGGAGDLIRMSNLGTGDGIDLSHASSGKAVRISNTGTGDSLYILDSFGDTSPFVLTANGDLGIGAAAPSARLEITGDASLADVTLLKFQATNDADIQSEIYFSAGGNATNWNVNSSGNGGALVIKDGTAEVGKFLNNGFIINDGSAANIDFRVESDTNTHSLFADATNGYIGFDQSVPLAKLHVGNTTAGASADYDYMRLQGTGDVDHRLYIPTGSNLMIWDYNVTGNGGAIEFRNGASRVGMFTNSGLVINEGGVTGVGLRVEGDTMVNLLFTDAANDRVGIGTNAPAARFHATQSGNTVAVFDRTTSDGTIISLRQAGVEEGTISVSGTTVSYNAFTGSHYAWTEENLDKGMLVSLTGDNRNLHNNPQSEIVYGVAKTAVVNDSKVMGAYLSLQESNKAYDESNPHLIMAVGNGEMWVADKGENINIGDYLISSDVVGHAQKDSGEFIVSHIVAKAAESIDWLNVTAEINGVKHTKISVFFESFDKSNMQSSVAGTSLQGGESNLEVVDLAVGSAVFEGNVTVMGHVMLNRDSVGQALILTGENRVQVAFEVPYDQLPIVTVTPYGAKRMDYGVENVSLTGFDIVIDPVQYTDTVFNWHAFGNREAKVFVSNGTTLDIEMTDMGTSKLETQINANGITPVPAPVEEVIPSEPETVTEPSPMGEPPVEETTDQPLPEPETQAPQEPDPVAEEEPVTAQETVSEPEQATVTEI